MRRVLDFPVQAHLERSLRVQRCPTIASAPGAGRTRRKADDQRTWCSSVRGS